MTSATPDRPRATRSRKNASQPAPSSAEVTCDPQDFAVALGVDPGGDQGVYPDDTACLADLKHQRHQPRRTYSDGTVPVVDTASPPSRVPTSPRRVAVSPDSTLTYVTRDIVDRTRV